MKLFLYISGTYVNYNYKKYFDACGFRFAATDTGLAKDYEVSVERYNFI